MLSEIDLNITIVTYMKVCTQAKIDEWGETIIFTFTKIKRSD